MLQIAVKTTSPRKREKNPKTEREKNPKENLNQ